MNIGGQDYITVPLLEDASAISRRHRLQRSELQRFDSPELAKMEVFPYDRLPRNKKRIRLLQLRSGTTHGPEVFCRLIPADYDDEFHILVPAKEGGEESSATQTPQDVVALPKTSGSTQPPPPAGETADQRRQREKQEKEKKREAEKKNREDREARKKQVKEKEIIYEALSWAWGLDDAVYAVQIEVKGKMYKKAVKKELALALKYLRLPDKERTLWIDAICIDQGNNNEKNHQVQMMSRIYTRANEVAVWLGEDNEDSTTAIRFIHEKIIKLEDFDSLCADKTYSDQWRALMMLMQRSWFSRRWVVQEIALASNATIYCGPDSISWNEFAVAVELFVEVESATHRLSEIMQNDERFRFVPGWFEYIAELGASLLVQATGKVFRAHRMPISESVSDKVKNKPPAIMYDPDPDTIDPLNRRSLLSLVSFQDKFISYFKQIADSVTGVSRYHHVYLRGIRTS